METLEKCLDQSEEKISKYDSIFLHVFAPTITSYIEWVLQEATKRKLQRLYFLSRDGWLMYLAAQEIAKRSELKIELRYLKVSRYSLRRAEYKLLGVKCLDRLLVGGIDVTFEKIMKRAALTDSEILQIAELAGYSKEIRKTLNYIEIQKLREKLFQIPLFFEYIYTHSQECLDDTLGYLRQEGLMEEVSYGIVDSGWVGTIQLSLKNLVSHTLKRDKVIEGFYFGIFELPEEASIKNYHSFYIDGKKEIDRKVRFSVCLFETIFSSPEGMTLGYQRCGDKQENKYIPIDSEQRNPNGVFMERNRELLLSYLSEYQKIQDSPKEEKRDKVVEKLLMLCMGTPTLEEAKALGTLLFCDDVLELQIQKVAAEWGQKELHMQNVIPRIMNKVSVHKDFVKESGWPEGSIMLAGIDTRYNLRQERLYKRLMYIRKAF